MSRRHRQPQLATSFLRLWMQLKLNWGVRRLSLAYFGMKLVWIPFGGKLVIWLLIQTQNFFGLTFCGLFSRSFIGAIPAIDHSSQPELAVQQCHFLWWTLQLFLEASSRAKISLIGKQCFVKFSKDLSFVRSCLSDSGTAITFEWFCLFRLQSRNSLKFYRIGSMRLFCCEEPQCLARTPLRDVVSLGQPLPKLTHNPINFYSNVKPKAIKLFPFRDTKRIVDSIKANASINFTRNGYFSNQDSRMSSSDIELWQACKKQIILMEGVTTAWLQQG